MNRRYLRPACLGAVDARTLADDLITDLEKAADEERIEAYLARAETSSPLLTPTVIGPTPYQKLWRLRFFTGTLELETARVIEQLIRSLGCDFLDVGAHVGYFSILAAQAGATAITAIEMHRPNWRLLKVNVPSARHVLAAAGEQAAEVKYHIGRGHSNHSLSSRPDTSDQFESCTVVTLDSLAASAATDNFTVVKIDVQGHENQVLRGFRHGLQSGRPIIVFEVERNDRGPALDEPYSDALRLLQSYEYRLFSIQDRELVELDGATDALLAQLPVSSNLLAIAAARFNDIQRALHRRI